MRIIRISQPLTRTAQETHKQQQIQQQDHHKNNLTTIAKRLLQEIPR